MGKRGPLLALVVGMALLVMPASAAASHSVLCKENVSVCPAASTWPANTYVSSAVGYVSTYAEFELPGLVTIASCGAGKFSGPVSPNAEGPATGNLEMFFFSSCKPEGCSVSAEGGKFAWEWAASGGGDGMITVSKPWISAICTKSPFPFNCKYSAATLSAKFEGGSGPPAYVKDEGTAMSLIGGTSCAVSKANLRFRSSAQSLGPFYLTN